MAFTHYRGTIINEAKNLDERRRRLDRYTPSLAFLRGDKSWATTNGRQKAIQRCWDTVAEGTLCFSAVADLTPCMRGRGMMHGQI